MSAAPNRSAGEALSSPALPGLTIGLVADTHIPDRVGALHPLVEPTLRQACVSHILHAGDICVPQVLDALRGIAPVTAVRGNRDFLVPGLAMIERVELGGAPIALMHGHIGLITYLWDKVQYWAAGYHAERYFARLERHAGAARAVVFGHTHYPVVTWRNGRLLVNPGSASFGFRRGEPPTLGLLHIDAGGGLRAEILPLPGYEIQNRAWVEA